MHHCVVVVPDGSVTDVVGDRLLCAAGILNSTFYSSYDRQDCRAYLMGTAFFHKARDLLEVQATILRGPRSEEMHAVLIHVLQNAFEKADRGCALLTVPAVYDADFLAPGFDTIDFVHRRHHEAVQRHALA
jgi:hypothetical protein